MRWCKKVDKHFSILIKKLSIVEVNCIKNGKSQVALHLEHKVEILNANQQINQLLRNSFQWFHEDSLSMDAINIVPPTRLQV